jgi:hypothetical protein
MGPMKEIKINWSKYGQKVGVLDNTEPKRYNSLFVITQLNFCFSGLSQIR